MARISEWEKNQKTTEVHQTLIEHPFGLRESELSNELGWERRTVNNYLHALEDEGLVYKEGWEWYAEYDDA
jgi:predicted transcriptional regulator